MIKDLFSAYGRLSNCSLGVNMEKCKVLCLKCKIETNQEIISSQKISDTWEEEGVVWWEDYQIIKCLGCDSLSFRKTYGSSEDYDPYTGEEITYDDLYPSRFIKRSNMEGWQHFPPKIRKIYSEALDALNNKLLLLSAVGLRMLIEAICLEESINGRNLAEKIDKLADKGLLSKDQADFLHKHRFLGNDAAHEIKAPKAKSLVAALDVAETLLKTIYIIPVIADDI